MKTHNFSGNSPVFRLSKGWCRHLSWQGQGGWVEGAAVTRMARQRVDCHCAEHRPSASVSGSFSEAIAAEAEPLAWCSAQAAAAWEQLAGQPPSGVVFPLQANHQAVPPPRLLQGVCKDAALSSLASRLTVDSALPQHKTSPSGSFPRPTPVRPPTHPASLGDQGLLSLTPEPRG